MLRFDSYNVWRNTKHILVISLSLVKGNVKGCDFCSWGVKGVMCRSLAKRLPKTWLHAKCICTYSLLRIWTQ